MTSAAATGSRLGRFGCSSSSACRLSTCRHGRPSMPRGCDRRRDASSSCRCHEAAACTRPSSVAPSSMRCSWIARDAGAEVHEGAALTGIHEHADAIELEVDHVGTVRADMAIGADGMWSSLRKMLGSAEPGYLGEWHAFRQYFAHVGPARGDAAVGVVRDRPAAGLCVVVPARRRTRRTSGSASRAAGRSRRKR